MGNTRNQIPFIRTGSPKVSIIIPVYKAEKYLSVLFACLKRQTYHNIEVIFVEDGSPDRSGKMLDIIAGMDDRFRVIHQENQGTAAARNHGIETAVGKYLMFIDDDDRVPATYVEEYVSAAEKMQADIVIGGYQRVAEDGRILQTRRLVKKPRVTDERAGSRAKDNSGSLRGSEWLKYVQITPWARIYRAKFVRDAGAGFLPYTYGEDIYFQMMLYAARPRIGYIPTVSYRWMSWEASVTNTLHKGIRKEADIFPMLEKLLEIYPEKEPLFRYFIYRHCAYHIFSSGRGAGKGRLEGELRRCKEWLREQGCSLAVNPFSPALRGERFRDRAAVALLWLTARLHLEKPFAWIYG